MQRPVQGNCWAMLPVTGLARLLRAAGFHMGSLSHVVLLQVGLHNRSDSCAVILSLGFGVHGPWSLE